MIRISHFTNLVGSGLEQGLKIDGDTKLHEQLLIVDVGSRIRFVDIARILIDQHPAGRGIYTKGVTTADHTVGIGAVVKLGSGNDGIELHEVIRSLHVQGINDCNIDGTFAILIDRFIDNGVILITVADGITISCNPGCWLGQ